MSIQPPVLEAATSEPPAAEEKVCQSPSPKEGFRAQAQHLQSLVQRAEALVDPEARALTRECLESLLALYGNGLARILSLVQEDSVHGAEILDRLIHDPEISGLLLIHEIHPDDLPTRLQQALDKVRPYMESHGGNVELLELKDGYARLRLKGACHTCPSSTITLQLAVRSALEDACPDLAGFDVE